MWNVNLRDDLRKREKSDYDIRRMSVKLTITFSNRIHSLFIKKIKKGKRRQVGRKQTSIVVIQENSLVS